MLLLSLFEPCQRLGVLFLVQVGREPFAVMSYRFGPYLVDVPFVRVLRRFVDTPERPEPPVTGRVRQKFKGVGRPEENALARVLLYNPTVRRSISVILLT